MLRKVLIVAAWVAVISILVFMFLPPVAIEPSASPQMAAICKLHQIGIAIHNDRIAHGMFRAPRKFRQARQAAPELAGPHTAVHR